MILQLGKLRKFCFVYIINILSYFSFISDCCRKYLICQPAISTVPWIHIPTLILVLADHNTMFLQGHAPSILTSELISPIYGVYLVSTQLPTHPMTAIFLVLQWTFLNFPTFSVFLAIFQVLLDPVPRKMRDRAGRNGLAIQSRGCS